MNRSPQPLRRFLKDNLFANRGTRQVVAKNSFWLLLAEGSTKGVVFLVAILVARHYSVEQYGVFGFVFSVSAVLAMVADFGLASLTVRELAGKPAAAEAWFGRAISLKILLSGVSFLLMAGVSACLEPGVRGLALLAGGGVLLEGMTDYLRTTFRVREEAQYEAVVKAGAAGILIVLVGSAVAFRFPLHYLLAACLAAQFLGLVLALSLVRQRVSLCFDWALLRPIAAEAWPLFLGLICTSVYGQVDLILIRFFRGFAEVGLYQASYRILFGFQLLRVMHMALLPRQAALYAAGDVAGYRRLMRGGMAASLVLLLPVGLVCTLFPDRIVGLVFGAGYARGAGALPPLIWSGVLSFLATFLSQTLVVTGRQRSWLSLEFAALAVLLALELTLIPVLGFVAAAWATLAGEVVFLVLILYRVGGERQLRRLFLAGDQEEGEG